MAAGDATVELPQAGPDPGQPAPAAGRPWPPEVLWQRWSGRLESVAGPAQQAAWALSGLLLGVAVAHVFHWSAPSAVVAALIGAALSWAGRGVATVLVAAVVTLGTIGVALRLTMAVAPNESWSMWWLLPLSLLLMAALVVVARRIGVGERAGARLASALLDLAAGGGSLVLALFCSHRIGSASPSLILLSSEDNAAWMNMAGNLRNASGVTHDTTPWVSLYGPVANTYVAFTRELTGGMLPHRIPLTQDALVVLSSHVLLIVVAPVVAALMARRTLVHGRVLLTLLTWAAVSTLAVSYLVLTPYRGFLTAGLAIVLVLVAASLVPFGRGDVLDGCAVVRLLAGAVAVYAAGSSWIPLAPLAAVALLVWWAGLAVQAVRSGPTTRLVRTGVGLLPVLAMDWALYRQYKDVVDPIGGGDSLFQSNGGTPVATTTMTVVAIGLVLASLVAYRGTGRSVAPTFLAAVVSLLGYTGLAMLDEAYTTRDVPHYGTIKLLFLTVALVLVLGVADLLASPMITRLRLDAAVCVVVAGLFAATVEQGPLSAAASGHWPKAQPPTIWIKSVTRETKTPGRVLCLALTPAQDATQPSLDSYLCTRWAASLRGGDDEVATTWRAVQINRAPVTAAVNLVTSAHDLPWRIVYIGTKAQLHDPKAWYAPIVAQKGLTFVSSGF